MKKEINVLKKVRNYFKTIQEEKEATRQEEKRTTINLLNKVWTKVQIKDYNCILIANSAGWIGGGYTVDPINNLFLFMSGNRSHNRMTFIDPAQREKVLLDEKGKKTIVLPDGSVKIDATRFAWDRDEVVVHPALKLAIQYKMVEDLYAMMNEKVETDEKIRCI